MNYSLNKQRRREFWLGVVFTEKEAGAALNAESID